MAEGCAVGDPYAVLDIAPGATRDELRQAFRRLAKQTHPDRGGDRRAFDAVRRAYVALLPGAPEAEVEADRAQTAAGARPGDEAHEAHEAPMGAGRPFDERTATVMRRYRTTIDLDLTACAPARRATTSRGSASWRMSPPAHAAQPTRFDADRGAFSSLLAAALAH